MMSLPKCNARVPYPLLTMMFTRTVLYVYIQYSRHYYWVRASVCDVLCRLHRMYRYWYCSFERKNTIPERQYVHTANLKFGGTQLLAAPGSRLHKLKNEGHKNLSTWRLHFRWKAEILFIPVVYCSDAAVHILRGYPRKIASRAI